VVLRVLCRKACPIGCTDKRTVCRDEAPGCHTTSPGPIERQFGRSELQSVQCPQPDVRRSREQECCGLLGNSVPRLNYGERSCISQECLEQEIALLFIQLSFVRATRKGRCELGDSDE
jgi:hypothetical protein